MEASQPAPEPATSGGSRSATSIALWRHFGAVIGVWGAALLGLSVAVLPPSLLSGTIGMGIAQPVLAGIAALIGGAIGFVGARAVHHRAKARRQRERRAESLQSVLQLSASEQNQGACDPASHLPPPRSCTLAEFGALEGRNAVWVDAGCHRRSGRTVARSG